jgi:hypothetical protein
VYIREKLKEFKIAYVPADAATRVVGETNYAFEEDGFYMTLTERVRKHFGAEKPTDSVTKNIKATRWWAVKVALMTLGLLVTTFMAFIMPDVNRPESVWWGALAGFFLFGTG